MLEFLRELAFFLVCNMQEVTGIQLGQQAVANALVLQFTTKQ